MIDESRNTGEHTLWEVYLRFDTHAEKPGEWAAAETLEMFELEEGLIAALTELRWIVRVMRAGWQQRYYELQRDVGADEHVAPGAASLRAYCAMLNGPDDPDWPFRIRYDPPEPEIYQIVMHARSGEEAETVIEQLPLERMGVLYRASKAELFQPSQPFPELDAPPPPPDENDIVHKLLAPTTSQQLDEYVAAFEEPTAEWLLLFHHAYQFFSRLLRQKDCLEGLKAADGMRRMMLKVIREGRHIDELHAKIHGEQQDIDNLKAYLAEMGFDYDAFRERLEDGEDGGDEE